MIWRMWLWSSLTFPIHSCTSMSKFVLVTTMWTVGVTDVTRQDIYFLRPISNECKISRICSSILSIRSSNLFLFRCYNVAYKYCLFKTHQMAWRTHGLFLKKTIVFCLKTVTWCYIVYQNQLLFTGERF